MIHAGAAGMSDDPYFAEARHWPLVGQKYQYWEALLGAFAEIGRSKREKLKQETKMSEQMGSGMMVGTQAGMDDGATMRLSSAERRMIEVNRQENQLLNKYHVKQESWGMPGLAVSTKENDSEAKGFIRQQAMRVRQINRHLADIETRLGELVNRLLGAVPAQPTPDRPLRGDDTSAGDLVDRLDLTDFIRDRIDQAVGSLEAL